MPQEDKVVIALKRSQDEVRMLNDDIKQLQTIIVSLNTSVKSYEARFERNAQASLKEKKENLPMSNDAKVLDKKRPQEDDVGENSKIPLKRKIKCLHRLPTWYSQVGHQYVII